MQPIAFKNSHLFIKSRSVRSFILLCLFSFFFISTTNSQATIEINGVITDVDEEPLDLALVSLLNTEDSTYVKSEFTDTEGSFIITKVSSGEYILQVNLLGYMEYSAPLLIDEFKKVQTLSTIAIEQDVNILDEVTIVSKVPFIERKIDRTIVNPDALISSAGSDVLDVLERAPGIQLDNDGSIILKGRSGVQVFINDKPSYLSGSDLESYLRSLPAGTVKRIEIMTNPPAKYEAAGNSGVINIVLKRNKLLGFHGNTTASYRQGKFSGSNNSLNLNFNKNDIALSANVYGGYWNSFQDLTINRFYKNNADEVQSAFSQNSINRRTGQYLNARLGIDYFIGDNTSVGLAYKNNTGPSDRGVDNIARVTDASNVLNQRVLADNNTAGTFEQNLINFYINHGLDTIGSFLSFDADYVKYNSGADQIFKNLQYDRDDNLTYQDQINGNLPSEINIYAAKVDYTKPLADGSKMEAGVKTAFTKTDNEALYTTTLDGVTEIDYDLSNRFLYKEWINASYINYNTSFGPIDIQAGLRLETTRLNGEQLGNIVKPDTSFTRAYTNLFPTFYASWRMDSLSNNILTFSYGRRIDRPYFQDLNPFIRPLDRFTFYSGNPDLLPTFSHNLSLSHSYKGFFTTSFNYSETLDGINETLEIRDEIYYSRPGNIANSTSLSLSIETSIPMTKWYDVNVYAELARLTFDSPLYTEQLNSSGTYHYLSANNNFNFGKGWSSNVRAFYRSDMVYSQLVLKDYMQVDMGIQKRILEGAGSLKLSVNDVFFTRRGDGIINNLQRTDADWNSTYDSRGVRLTFSWRFGKSTLKKQKYNSSGSKEEQNRVKE